MSGKARSRDRDSFAVRGGILDRLSADRRDSGQDRTGGGMKIDSIK